MRDAFRRPGTAVAGTDAACGRCNASRTRPAFEPWCRRPKSSPSAICPETVELITRLRKELAGQGLDAGPQIIAWHLEHHHQVKVSVATISRCLTRQGLVIPDPAKRPKSSCIRFAAEMPNECWQSGFTRYPLAGGIVTWLDDHSRYALSVTAHARVTGPAVLRAFRAASRSGLDPHRQRHGLHHPRVRRQGRPQRPRARTAPPRRQAEERQAEPPPDPGVERFQQTMKNWLRARPHQPATLAGLQSLLDAFAGICNTRRPHRSLPGRATPATAYSARPKAVPGDRTADTHDRVRTDRIDRTGLVTLRHSGRLHHIGTGRPHAGTRVLLLVQDLHIRVINAGTGELIRELVLNPGKTYQPTGRPSGLPKKTPRPLCGFAVSSMSCDITVVAGVGFEPT
jgi:hypothetical protein